MSDSVELINKRLRDISEPSPLPSSHDQTTVDQHSDNSHEDHPSNSLLRLNDDCLRHIFDNFDKENLCQLTDVCTRLQSIAEQTFTKQYKEMNFVDYLNDYEVLFQSDPFIDYLFDTDQINLDQVNLSILEDCQFFKGWFRRILCKFGHLITSIRSPGVEFSQERVDALVKYVPNLEMMRIDDIFLDFELMEPLFERAKYLHLNRNKCIIGNENVRLKNCSNLKVLHIPSRDLKFFANAFPNLIELELNNEFNASDDSFMRILSLNPQLKRLNIFTGVNDSHITTIVQHAKNLEFLNIATDQFPSFQTTENGFLQLSQLKNLKEFHFCNQTGKFGNLMAPLMTAFAKEHVNLEDIRLFDFPIDSNDLKSIHNMKTLKYLHLNEIMTKSVTDDDLVSLITELPSLIYLRLEFDDAFRSTPASVLINMVNAGKQLISLELCQIRNFNIDQKVFEALLEAASNRLTRKQLAMLIVGCGTTGILSPDIQDTNLQQLKLGYYPDGSCRCKSCKDKSKYENLFSE